MLCKQCCRIFIPLFLWVFLPLNAAAYPVLRDDPEKIARVHCQLLLHALSTEEPLTTGLLDTMAGEEGFSESAGIASDYALQQMTGNMPDFGFLIGHRWTLADRNTRARFNRLMSQLLAKRGHLQAQADYSSTCRMEVHIIQANPKEESLPREERAYLAEATTHLPQAAPNETLSVPLVYALRKEPGKAWEITDLNFFHTGLVSTYGSTYTHLVATQGFEGLLRSLEQELVAPLPTR